MLAGKTHSIDVGGDPVFVALGFLFSFGEFWSRVGVDGDKTERHEDSEVRDRDRMESEWSRNGAGMKPKWSQNGV